MDNAERPLRPVPRVDRPDLRIPTESLLCVLCGGKIGRTNRVWVPVERDGQRTQEIAHGRCWHDYRLTQRAMEHRG